MTFYTLSLLLTFGAAVAFLGWLIVRGGTLKEAPAPPEPVKAKRLRGPLTEAFCPVCGQAGVYLTKRGLPNRRFHVCAASVNAPSVLVPFVQIYTGRPEPESVLTTGTWPPEKTEASS